MIFLLCAIERNAVWLVVGETATGMTIWGRFVCVVGMGAPEIMLHILNTSLGGGYPRSLQVT